MAAVWALPTFVCNEREKILPHCESKKMNGDLVYIDDVVLEGCYSGSIVNPEVGSGLIYETVELDIEIMPNPVRTSEELLVNIQSGSETAKLHLFDMYGSLIQTKDIAKKSFEGYRLPTDSLSDGTYVLRIETEKGYKMKKLVVIR